MGCTQTRNIIQPVHNLQISKKQDEEGVLNLELHPISQQEAKLVKLEHYPVCSSHSINNSNSELSLASSASSRFNSKNKDFKINLIGFEDEEEPSQQMTIRKDYSRASKVPRSGNSGRFREMVDEKMANEGSDFERRNIL